MTMSCPSTGLCSPPDCARFESINQGQPLTIYHDLSNFIPNWYTVLSQPPEYYFNIAVDLWNSAYPCGDLFEVTTDANNHMVDVVYIQDDNIAASGYANSLAGPDGTICTNIDQGTVWGVNNPATVTINQRTDLQLISEDQYSALMLHELGHILGMGHVVAAGIPSVLGTGEPGGQFRLEPWDIQQVNLRYPCCAYTDEMLSAAAPIPDLASNTIVICTCGVHC